MRPTDRRRHGGHERQRQHRLQDSALCVRVAEPERAGLGRALQDCARVPRFLRGWLHGGECVRMGLAVALCVSRFALDSPTTRLLVVLGLKRRLAQVVS